MIREDMRRQGIELSGETVYEVEIVRYEEDGEDYACLDTLEVFHIGTDEEEGFHQYEVAKQRLDEFEERYACHLQDDEIVGLRFNRYEQEEDGSYQPCDGDDYYGEED